MIGTLHSLESVTAFLLRLFWWGLICWGLNLIYQSCLSQLRPTFGVDPASDYDIIGYLCIIAAESRYGLSTEIIRHVNGQIWHQHSIWQLWMMRSVVASLRHLLVLQSRLRIHRSTATTQPRYLVYHSIGMYLTTTRWWIEIRSRRSYTSPMLLDTFLDELPEVTQEHMLNLYKD